MAEDESEETTSRSDCMVIGGVDRGSCGVAPIGIWHCLARIAWLKERADQGVQLHRRPAWSSMIELVFSALDPSVQSWGDRR